VHCNLAAVWAQQQRWKEAMAEFQLALRLKPDHGNAHYGLGAVLYQQGRAAEALTHWREALRLQPEAVAVLQRTAWLLASSRDASLRNAGEAVELAQRAVRLSAAKDPAALDTLAVAQAAAGRFAEAAQTAAQAMELAAAAGNATLADAIAARRKLYQENKPFCDAGGSP
jgi:Flp pilus assembly protein TadD